MPEVVEINQIEDLDRYQLLWKSMVGDTPNATFFHSLDWLRIHLTHNPQLQLKALVIFSMGNPIGIVPFVRQSGNSFLGNVTSLSLPVHDWCANIGPLGPNPTGTLTAALKYIRKQPRDWDTMELALTEPPFNFERLMTALEITGFSAQTKARSSSGIVQTNTNWPAYLTRRPAGFVNRLERLRERLPDLGPTSYVRYRPEGFARGEADPRWDILKDCLNLARQHWQGRTRGGALIVNQTSGDFLTRLHEVATHSGALDLNLLLVKDEPAAFFYNVQHFGRCQTVWWACNPEFAKFGIDRILLAHMIQDSMERGDAWIDVGRDGVGRWRPWMTRMAVTRQFIHYPRTAAKAQALRVSRWMKSRFDKKRQRSGTMISG